MTVLEIKAKKIIPGPSSRLCSFLLIMYIVLLSTRDSSLNSTYCLLFHLFIAKLDCPALLCTASLMFDVSKSAVDIVVLSNKISR